MSPPTAKRRKLGDSNVLFKPFKSPMKVPDTGSTGPPSEPHNSTVSNPSSRSDFAKRLRQVKSESKNSTQSDEFSKLRKNELALLSQISALKTELGHVNQAHLIETSNQTELLDLIKTWRSASQQAAEDCYAVFRDKVNAVGGLRRWNEAEKERKDNSFSSWGLTEEVPECSEGQEEVFSQPEPQEEFGPDEERMNQELTLSMDVMLRYMAIEPSIIGYDIDNQRWLP